MKKFDLIVCGAGMAGFAAAVGAARAGSKVLLLDKMPSVGGMAVYAITGFLSGWPFPRRAGGVADELVKLLEERKALVWRNNAAYEEDALQMAMLDMLRAEGVEMLFNAVITGADSQDKILKNVTVQCGGSKLTFEADYFIDATGDAVLAEVAGAATATPEPELSMTKTLMFKVGNIKNFDKTVVAERFKTLVHDFPVRIQDKFMGTPLSRPDEMVLNLTAVAGNATDPVVNNAMHEELLRQIPVIVEWLQKNFDEFAECHITKIAPMMGVRYSRSIVGQRMLTLEDMRNPEPPPEPVALCNSYIGGHYISSFDSPWGKQITGKPAIPYGALRSVTFDNLLAAGRNIAADPRVISAVRLNVNCMASGQAAGIAAALKIPAYSELCKELTRQNCLYQK